MSRQTDTLEQQRAAFSSGDKATHGTRERTSVHTKLPGLALKLAQAEEKEHPNVGPGPSKPEAPTALREVSTPLNLRAGPPPAPHV